MSASSAAGIRLARAASIVGTIALYAVGVLIDCMGLVNVPGAVRVSEGPDGAVTLGGSGPVLFLLIVVVWGTVFWRRRMPWLPLAGGAALTLIGIGYLLLLIGAVNVVRRYPRRTVGVAIGACLAVLLFATREAFTDWGGALPYLFTNGSATQHDAGWVLAAFGWAAVSLSVAAGVVILHRARDRELRSTARAVAQQRRADTLSEQMVRQSERERIARDVHDQLTSRLAVVSLHAGALEAASGRDETAEMARTVREQTHAALQDLRGLLGDLRTDTGLAPSSPATLRALGTLLGEIRASGVEIEAYIVIEAPERASTQFDSAVYRIVQEALTNARKHAPGERIEVYVCVDPADGARVRVVNPLSHGNSLSTLPGGGHGVLGIRERVAALEGTAWIGSHEDEFIVDVTLPWQERG